MKIIMISNTYSVIYLMPVMSCASTHFICPFLSKGVMLWLIYIGQKWGSACLDFLGLTPNTRQLWAQNFCLYRPSPTTCAAHAEMLVAKLLSVWSLLHSKGMSTLRAQGLLSCIPSSALLVNYCSAVLCELSPRHGLTHWLGQTWAPTQYRWSLLNIIPSGGSHVSSPRFFPISLPALGKGKETIEKLQNPGLQKSRLWVPERIYLCPGHPPRTVGIASKHIC